MENTEEKTEAKVAKAYLRQLRMSPRKVKVVLDLIRDKDVKTAKAILQSTNRLACESVGKLLKSAVANAENNFNMDTDKLYVAQCWVTPGKLKNMRRVRPRARGSAARIIKRTSHITIALGERE